MSAPNRIEKAKQRHTLALTWQSNGNVPLLIRSYNKHPAINWEEYTNNPQAVLDYMLPVAEKNHAIGSDIVPLICFFYGAGILLTVFGGKIFFLNNSHNYSPADISFLDSGGNPGQDMSFVNHIIKTFQYLKAHVPPHIFVPVPHLTSPLGVAAIMAGPTNLYMDMAANPDRAHRLLSIVTDSYINTIKYLYAGCGRDFTFTIHPMDGLYLEKAIWMADDAVVPISPDNIREFDLRYTERIARSIDAKIMTHYCITEKSMAMHCLETMAAAPHLLGILNHYTPEFFIENYHVFKQRFALLSFMNYESRFGATPKERIRKFGEWAKKFMDSFRGKSGLMICIYVFSVEEGQEVYGIWESLNHWPR